MVRCTNLLSMFQPAVSMLHPFCKIIHTPTLGKRCKFKIHVTKAVSTIDSQLHLGYVLESGIVLWVLMPLICSSPTSLMFRFCGNN
jgi:hypothetical protein